MINQGTDNCLKLTCESVDFVSSRDVTVWIQQSNIRLEYKTEAEEVGDGYVRIVGEHELSVFIPLKDAIRLRHQTPVKLQVGMVPEEGLPCISEILTVGVRELLKETGYGEP